jgi:hypothetical protein
MVGEPSTATFKIGKRKEPVITAPFNPLVNYNNGLGDNDKFIISKSYLKSLIDLYNIYIKTLKA